EVAEGAREDAQVGRVDVPVDDEVDPVAGSLALDAVRQPAEAEQVVGLQAGQPVLEPEPLAVPQPVAHAGQPAIPDADLVERGSHRSSSPPGATALMKRPVDR